MVLNRAGCLLAGPVTAQEGGPVSLQQSLIDLFIVSVIAALTPIVAGPLPGSACLRW